MKRLLIITASLLVLGIAGTIWLRQRQNHRAAQQHTAALQSQVQALESELAQKQAAAPPMISEHSASLSPRTNLAPATAANASVDGKAAPNPALLTDPETRTLMRQQQQQALGKTVDRFISTNFIRELNLTPEQAARVKEAVRAKAAAGTEFSTAMLFDGLDDDALAQRGRETKQIIDEADSALRALLGADGFNALRERERSMPEEDGVKKFREELATAGEPLSDEQRKSLLASMSAERQAFTFRIDYSDPATYDFEHIRDYFSAANLQTYFEDLQQVNSRIAERAALFLSTAQLDQLKTAQKAHLDQARLTVKMTTELFNKRRPN